MRNLSFVRILGRFRDLVGSTSTSTKAANPKPSSDAARTTDGSFANLKIIEKFNQELVSIRTYLEAMHTKLQRVAEHISHSEGKLQQVVNGNAKIKVKQTENSKLWQGLNLEVSMKTQCDKLTETPLQLACHTEKADEEKKYVEEMLGKNSRDEFKYPLHDLLTKWDCAEHNIISEKLVKDKASVKIDLQMAQQKRATEQRNLSEGELQQVVNGNANLKVKETEDSKHGQGLATSTKTLCDPPTETLQQLACEKQQGSVIKKLEGSNAMVQHIEVTENKLRRLDSEAEISAANINWVGKLPYEDCKAIIEICKKKELEKIEITNAKKEKAEKITSKMENKCSEKVSERYLMHLKEEHGTMVARIQQDKEHNESTLQAYLKEEMQRIQSQAENELREVPMKYLYFPFHQYRMLSSNSRNSTDERFPGNTATISLDEYDLPASRHSYIRAMNKVVEWCKSKTEVFDLSEFFGPGAEVFTTPAEGIFHLKVQCRERELTLFISARDLYLLGWEGDKHGAFEIQDDDENKRETCIPGCKLLKIGVNYRDVSKHALGDVRIGPLAMTHAFECLYKCDGISYNAALDAITIFAINTSEAIRDAEICKEVEDSFDLFPDKLDSRWDKKSEKAPLSVNVRTYSFYSGQYLKYVDCMLRRKPLPEIINRSGLNVKSIHELRSHIRVPLRDSYNEGKFEHEKRPKSLVWYPPYPDGENWISEQQEE